MQLLTLLGIVFLIVVNVFRGPGAFEEVYVAWVGQDRIAPAHHKIINSFYRIDNYIIDSKNEENPRYSSLSVRPEKETYLNDVDKAWRGLFHFQSPSGDDVIIGCTEDTVFKSSGTVWTTLEAGMSDNPWEGVLFPNPNVTRLYLCNGLDDNKKYLSGKSVIYNMQNQDDETTISGNMWFTASSLTATGDAVAIASLEAGQYIKYSTAGSDIEWNEITSIEGVTVEISSLYAGTVGSQAAVVRSNDIDNSRYMLEFEGHMVLGYTSVAATSLIVNTEITTQEYGLRKAYGVAQSFQATSNTVTGVRLSIYRPSGYPIGDVTTSNIIIKLKDAIDASVPLAEIMYPVANLPTTATKTLFNFGNVSVTSGSTYYITVERENSSTIPVYIRRGSALANGNAYWTFNPTGFDASWTAGLTTVEVNPDISFSSNYGIEPDGYMDQANPTTNYGTSETLYAGIYSGNTRKTTLRYLIEYDAIFNDVNNWASVEVELYKTGTGTGEVNLYALANVPDMTNGASWTYRLGASIPWITAGCSSPESDFFSAGAVTAIHATTAEGLVSFDVTGLATWSVTSGADYGFLISPESAVTQLAFNSNYSSSTKPAWKLTVETGTSEATHDLFIEILSETSNRSTIVYSKRFKPENFPFLNTFDIAGQVVGLAKTGGYLIVAGKIPDALHYYRYTGSAEDGEGIDFITSVYGITFGSSKSVAQLPVSGEIIFFSGYGVYRLSGLSPPILMSGKIREEAKKFSNYRDPRDYYGGLANMMPQGVVLPTKDTYLLATPNELANNSYIYTNNYALGAWTRWTSLDATAMLVRESGGSEPVLYMGFDDGQVYTLGTSGSTTDEAELEWFFSGKDITKNKIISYMDIWARADNPLRSCVVTLEVSSTDPVSTITQTAVLTLETGGNLPAIPDNTTTDNMVWIKFPFTKTAREFKFKLTQQATQGALSLRSIRYQYKIE